jgi:hypothetical protein
MKAAPTTPGKPFDAEILWHMLNKAVDTRARQIEAEQAAVYRTLAYTDALTGSPNRRFIDEFIVEAVSNSQRLGKPLAVAYLDIDNFKLLNDFWDKEGDHVLKGRRRAHTPRGPRSSPASRRRVRGRLPQYDEFAPARSWTGAAPSPKSKSSAARISAHPDRCGVAAFPATKRPGAIAEAEDQMYLDKSVSPTLIMAGQEQAAAPEALVKVTNLKALRSLVKAIDRRDSYTRFHSTTRPAGGAVARETGLDDAA